MLGIVIPKSDFLSLALILCLFHLFIEGTALRETLVQHFGQSFLDHAQVETLAIDRQSYE